MTTLTGHLLVAGPRLVDPNFARTVVLVAAHDDDGAIGVILNRPTEIDVSDHVPGWDSILVDPQVVFIGGPVQPEVAVALAGSSAPPEEGWRPISPHLGLFDLGVPPASIIDSIDRVRVFSGYSGWAPGQLEQEVAGNDWLIVPPGSDEPFSADPGEMWADVLRSQGPPISMYASYPPDLRLN